MVDVFVAAGSNVEPERHLALALHELRRSFADLRCSTAYRNTAVGFEGDDFINLVVTFSTALAPQALLAELHRIETLCGRPRLAPKWAPRSMDLDLLLFGDLLSDEPGMVLPRLDLTRRAYMLGPMAELAPDLQHPTLHRSMRELWQDFDSAAHPMHAVSLPRWESFAQR